MIDEMSDEIKQINFEVLTKYNILYLREIRICFYGQSLAVCWWHILTRRSSHYDEEIGSFLLAREVR